MNETNIAWTDTTWNPVHGCSKVSAGCDNCYAERISNRYNHTEYPWDAEHAEANVMLKPHKLEEPYSVKEPSRIFVNSMSDLFHTQVPDEYVREVFAVMRNCPQHIFQILTKRPGRAANMTLEWPENVWMGTSVEDQRVIKRLELLSECDAETLFVSFEPLIGPVDPEPYIANFDWVIVGGESGPDHRPMSHEWVWPIKDACFEYDIPFFFKQSSAPKSESGTALRCQDGKLREFKQIPSLPESTRQARDAITLPTAD